MCPVSSEEAHFSRSSTLERHPTNGLILRHTHLDSSILTLRVENKGDSVEQPDACDVHCRKGSEKSFHFPHRYASFSDSHRRSRLRRRRREPKSFFAGGPSYGAGRRDARSCLSFHSSNFAHADSHIYATSNACAGTNGVTNSDPCRVFHARSGSQGGRFHLSHRRRNGGRIAS